MVPMDSPHRARESPIRRSHCSDSDDAPARAAALRSQNAEKARYSLKTNLLPDSFQR